MHDDEYEEPTGKVPQNNEGYMTQQEVADALGLTTVQVDAAERKGLRMFKYYLLQKYKKEDL